MNTPYILPLADPNATLETVGGKGLSLAKMSRAGLPIPNGFHISTEAYRQFVAANDLQSTILTALKEVDVSTPASLETAAATIARLFPESNLPKEISDAIRDAYLTPVAVRSSATAEDLPEASFAGQQPGEVLVAPITTPA